MKTLRALRYFLAMICAILVPTISLANEQILRLDRAEFVLDHGELPPPDSAAWKPQQLPDNWGESRPNIGGFGWYRLRFHLVGQPQQPYALYLPRVVLNGAFYINGAYIGSSGQFKEPVARNWNRAQFYLIPTPALRLGPNTLHVRLWTSSNSKNNLLPISLGSANRLSPRFECRYFLQTTLTAISCAVIAANSLLTLYLWSRRRQDSVYGYIGFAMLFSIIPCANFYVRDLPISSIAWDVLVITMDCGSAIFVCFCALRMVDLRWPRFETLLWLFLLVAPTAMALGGSGSFLVGNALGTVTVLIYLTSVGALFARRFLWHRWKTEPAVVALIMAVVVGVHDIGMFSGIFHPTGFFIALSVVPWRRPL